MIAAPGRWMMINPEVGGGDRGGLFYVVQVMVKLLIASNRLEFWLQT